jgi:hypothetical protein
MRKKLIIGSITAGLIGLLITACPYPVVASETRLLKDTVAQRIPEGRWTNLQFSGKTTVRNKKSTRALYCTQLHLDIKDTKPKYVKIRFARHIPGKKLDTTGTTTWVIGKNGPRVFHGSMCWTMKTKYPVSVQVKVIGKASSWVSTQRQLKLWAPSSGIPENVMVIE